jgi:uncharacterized membrane protein YkoI
MSSHAQTGRILAALLHRLTCAALACVRLAPGVLLLGMMTLDSAADPPDHDRARAALERGEVRPLAEILAAAAAEVPGEVVELELEREHGRWVYELKVIAPDGRVLEVMVDAASARVLGWERD